MKYLYPITKTLSYILSIAFAFTVMNYAYKLFWSVPLEGRDHIFAGLICTYYAIDLFGDIAKGEKSLPIQFIVKASKEERQQ